MSERLDTLTELAERWGIDAPTLAGSGLEFSVYRARSRDGDPVALRVAHRRFDSNANDPAVDTRALLVQEYRITRHLAAHGFPVAEPVELFLSDDSSSPDVLLSRYVSDDGAPLDCFALGQLLARLHLLPPPRLDLVASEGMSTPEAVATRIQRRWAEVGCHVMDWPKPPSHAHLVRLLAGVSGNSLLHLDVRSDNTRREDGEITALLDWSNALPGSSAVEFGRLAEYALYAENELDMAALRAGYDTVRQAPPEDGKELLVCRLDAAVMLALVFLSEAPDPQRGAPAAEHVRELGAMVAALVA
ncbi:phosphotransferase enzyme family protein [Streptomyces sp. NBC_00076]|uniref:phosphotransferase enzyme family protein n=1 Tax=Streptomyces sp. NBC_00076 TaxID=2975642 RepID=UPI00324F070A